MERLDYEDVPGFEDNYYLDPFELTVVNKKTGHVLKPHIDNSGYPAVKLYKHNKGTHKYLHRLFAEAYIPNPNDYPCVNHKDEDTTNYELDNLEWCTQSYNQTYGTANERRGPKISEAIRGRPRPWVSERLGKPIIAIDGFGKEQYFPSAREAGRQLGIDQSHITSVLRGRRKTACGYRFRYA